MRKEAVKAAQVACQAEKEEALARAGKELEMVKRQLNNAITDKSDAAQRASQAHNQLQADLHAANEKLSEANKQRVAAQEKLKKETDTMLEQLKRAQDESARSIKVPVASSPRLLAFRHHVSKLTFVDGPEYDIQKSKCFIFTNRCFGKT